MGRKKTGVRDDEGTAVVTGKSKKKNVAIDDDDEYAIGTALSEETSLSAPVGGGLKKGNSKKSLSKDDDEMKPSIGGDEDDDEFSGKKKPSKSSKKGSFSFSLLDETNESKEDDEDFGSITFTGKKKKSSKPKNTFSTIVVDDENDYKGTKEDVAETRKNKKKKNKSTRTAQEEEDLDKILAELGEAPKPVPNGPNPLELQPVDVEKEAEEGAVESAAAKKKKKKKKKKATTTATAVEEKPEEIKAKATDKKVPQHVREMQEKLARLKEAEERKKREEEEKLRKEEEEARRQEELERIAEEKKRLKKEKEKEKLLKKKQEGKLLTPKQKEGQRKLEAKRKQILANAGGFALSAGDAAVQRPKYQNKKSKVTTAQAVIEAIEKVDEEEKAEEVRDVDENEVKDEEADKDEEWDVKSWDDADLKLPGTSPYAEEEAHSETEPVVKNETKSAPPASKKPEAGEQKPNGREVQVPEAGEESLRSPICCIMGHVDAGKTKLLDCIRGTAVQEGEAGGITQQIGATYFPAENIREKTKQLKADAKLNVPGLLVIDTPGHEAFTNLRSRGSGLCDLAILVVDIMHGLQPQTIESLNLLKMRNAHFIVALNKVDRLYGWKAINNAPIRSTMKKQSQDVKREFSDKLTQVKTQFMEQGINTALYYENKEMGETVSIVPTSAISGEGIPDLLLLLVQWAQKTMIEKLTFQNEVQCTVLEVKAIEGHGTTIDVVLANGVLHEGDQIVVCGMQVPIVTSIRALLTPHPMKELRVKGTYLHHKEIKAAQCIKITAQGLEHAIAGTALHVVGPDDDLDAVKDAAMEDVESVMKRFDKRAEGVYVQASTLGSLEAILEYLKTPSVSIPVRDIGLGPVHKRDVTNASVMLEKKKKEYATILAFDAKVTPEVQRLADETGVKIICADTIYRLFDDFKVYIDGLKEQKKKEAADEAVFPCVLKIERVCNHKSPILLGVEVLQGIAKIGTPLCIPSREFTDIGRIASIEINRKPVDCASKGQTVGIKIEEQGKHFKKDDEQHELVSHISRRSIDVLKAYYRDDLSMEEWKLLEKLEKIFKI